MFFRPFSTATLLLSELFPANPASKAHLWPQLQVFSCEELSSRTVCLELAVCVFRCAIAFSAASYGVVRCLPFWLGLCVCCCCAELLQVYWSSDLRMCSSKSESQGHPDPAKFHLNIVAKFLEKHLSYWAMYGIEDAAVFWDFGSLYQKTRTDLEEESFKEGLKASNRWYGSTQSLVWSGS